MEKHFRMKYIAPGSITDWIRNPRKSTRNVSNQWKALVRSFLVIGDYLAWKVGSREKVRLGTHVVLGCGDRFLLTEDSINSLHQRGLFTLSQEANESNTIIWFQGWRSAETLGLGGK